MVYEERRRKLRFSIGTRRVQVVLPSTPGKLSGPRARLGLTCSGIVSIFSGRDVWAAMREVHATSVYLRTAPRSRSAPESTLTVGMKRNVWYNGALRDVAHEEMRGPLPYRCHVCCTPQTNGFHGPSNTNSKVRRTRRKGDRLRMIIARLSSSRCSLRHYSGLLEFLEYPFLFGRIAFF
ncbi:hypothetical protein DFH07DRAFT_447454 [Mycena maculata]|uniref:Uncharacterized protein n=1 Tax=Mycena maculata TaxID=230809 RepID=A0AAD7J7V8_9AGAR|nr:hypothetical protein DFH07DRAFT_447454 [Mycena maculata]